VPHEKKFDERHIPHVVHSPDGKMAMSVSFTKVVMWDSETGEKIGVVYERERSRWPMSADWSKDGKFVTVLVHQTQEFKVGGKRKQKRKEKGEKRKRKRKEKENREGRKEWKKEKKEREERDLT
jgi:hypothetical protein